MRLKPIENPPGLLLKIAFWLCRRKYGKVLAPLKIIYSRKRQLIFVAMKIDKFEERQNSLPTDLRLFIKIAAAVQNNCAFCTDITLADAVKNKIGTEKFKGLLNYEVYGQAIFSEKERAVFGFVKEYAEARKVSDATFNDLQRLFSEHEIIDIIAVNAFEQYFNALAIPLEIQSDGLQKIAINNPVNLKNLEII